MEGGPPRAWRAALDRPEQAVRMRLDVFPYLRERGELHARARQWKYAATDFAAAIQANPADYWLWFQSACLWLMFDDTDMYRRYCRELLNRFGQTDDPAVAERIAKSCLLIADAVEDLAPVVRLVDRSVIGTENHEARRYFLLTRGLAYYRTGDFEAAVEILKKCLKPENPDIACDGLAYLVLSMAHHKLGNVNESAKSLAKSREILDVPTRPAIDSGNLGSEWHDVVIMHILRREAEALLKDTSVNPEK
jgi:tetratricopeptide (TPR) repeat protein